MLNYAYYPFKKTLEHIDGSDLSLLRGVSEGWYIDYKTQGLKVVEYGKHLSAFANQYGGWLIIGVQEKADGSRMAGSFPGVETSEVQQIILALREGASAHVNPEILYEEKVIEGPTPDIGLAAGKSIIVVGIPRSMNTPHVHSSGRIYRRLSDQSKPKAESDRYILDELWKRGDNHRKQTAKRLTDVPPLPKRQSTQPWVHIFFKPSEGQRSPSRGLTFDEFARIVGGSDETILGVRTPMEAIYRAPYGFVGRQVADNDPSLALLTIRWWNNGNVRFDVPLNVYDFGHFFETRGKNRHAVEYCNTAYEMGYKDVPIVDYSDLTQTVAGLTNSYLHMLRATNDRRDTYSCFNLRNVFYTLGFIDSAKFIERAKAFSLPLTIDHDIVIPEEPTEDNMFLHRAKDREVDFSEYQECYPAIFKFCFPVFGGILGSTGLVRNIEDYREDTELFGFDRVRDK